VQQAIAAPFAPSPEAIQQQSAPRVAKASVDAAQPRQAIEAIEPRTATQVGPALVGKTQANKTSSAQGVVNEIANTVPAQAATTDGPQSAQITTTATATMQASVQAQHAAADTGAQRVVPAGAQPAAPTGAQVAREIIRRFDGAATTFELRLDPPELGRVEVRMEVSRDHRVTAVIAADNPQALTELARHARDLEQQLQSAGLQLSDNGLSFDLRQGAERDEAEKARSAAGPNGGEEAPSEHGQAPLARPIGFERWRGVRVDMMV
jgi:flagellar hook-length control protein FliK